MRYRHHIISESIEALAHRLNQNTQVTKATEIDFEVVVVGTGYGGSVAAARLAEHLGEKLCVLERGQEYPLGSFPTSLADMPNQVRIGAWTAKKSFGNPSALFDVRLSADVNVLVGNGLGGGSLINAGVMARPLASVFDTKSEPLGQRVWPKEISLTTLEPFYKSALAAIEPEKTPNGLPLSDATVSYSKLAFKSLPQKGQAISALANGCGLSDRFETPPIAVTFSARKNVHGVLQNECIQCGDCFSGCNFGAKNTLDRTYLTSAFKYGAKIYVGAAVTSVERISDELWFVNVLPTDLSLKSSLGGGIRIRCKRVILAAGTLGSTEILKKSDALARNEQKTLVGTPQNIGSRFSGNGDMIAVGTDHNLPVNAIGNPVGGPKFRGVGPTITSMIDLRDFGKWAKTGDGPVVQELAAPGLLRWIFAEIVGNGAFLRKFTDGDDSSLKGSNLIEPLSADPNRMTHHQIYAMFGLDRSEGRVSTFDAQQSEGDESFAEGTTYVEWESIRRPPVVNTFTNSHDVLRDLIKDSGISGELLANPAWEPFSPVMAEFLFGAKRGPLVSVHPLGGCPMSDHSSTGVVNHLGQVFRTANSNEVHPSLVILDGSVIPTSLGINPGLTITAVAERAIASLISFWQLDQLEAPKPIENLAERIFQTPSPTEISGSGDVTLPSSIQLSERMLGFINLPKNIIGSAKPARLSMELSIGPILDIYDFTNDPDHSLQIEAAKLQIYFGEKENSVQATIPVEGHVKFARRIPTATWQRRLWVLVAATCNGYIFNLLRENLSKQVYSGQSANLWEKMKLAWAASSVLGERREYHYDMVVTEDFYLTANGLPRKINIANVPSTGDILFLGKGDRLVGKKNFRWSYKSNPWVQFTTLEVFLQKLGQSELQHIGRLRSDLSYFANFNTYLIKLFQQREFTTSLANIGSLITFFSRAIAQSHLLTFRTMSYKILPDSEFEPSASEPNDIPGLNLHRHTIGKAQLTHYVQRSNVGSDSEEKNLASRASVLLVHGFGASANTFTQLTPSGKNAVTELISHDFDVWLVDLRTSSASNYRKEYSSFDQTGDEDIVASCRYIEEWRKLNSKFPNSNDSKIHIIAHCVGVAMLSKPLLEGKLNGKIASLVLTQVGFVVELTAYNYARNALIAGLRQFIGDNYIDTRISPREAKQANGDKSTNNPASPPLIDWILSSFVYRPSEWLLLSSPWKAPAWLAQYNRMSALYAPLMNIKNMRTSTLAQLHRLISGVNLKAYSQSLFYSVSRRLTNRHGQVLLSVDAINSHIDFPILFLSGKDNRVFHTASSERSAILVANAWAQSNHKLADNFQSKRQAFSCQIPGYGHQDLWLGKNAHKDVLPHIVSFIKGDRTSLMKQAKSTVQEANIRTAYSSIIGPTMGWLQRTNSGFRVRIQFAHDKVAQQPESILCVMKNNTVRASNSKANVEEIRVYKNLKIENANDPDDAQKTIPTNITYFNVDINKSFFELEENLGSSGVQIFLFSIHDQEPIDKTSNPFMLPEKYFEALNQNDAIVRLELSTNDHLTLINRIEKGLLEGTFSRDQTNAEIDDLGFPSMDRKKQFPSIFVSKDSAIAADDPTGLSAAVAPRIDFALTSCQAPHFLFDRELSGDLYQKLSNRIDSLTIAPQKALPDEIGFRVPDFILAIGDQVYMDASIIDMGSASGFATFEKPYVEWLGNPAIRNVFSRIPLYAMLDDHEFRNGYVPSIVQKNTDKTLRDLYCIYQRQLSPDSTGLQRWFSLMNGGYPFFVMDTRSEREQRTIKNFESAKICSSQQFDALKGSLKKHRNSSCPFFIVSPSVIFPLHNSVFSDAGGQPTYCLQEDGWDGYPSSLKELFKFIALNEIENVVILSGDYHLSCVSTLCVQAMGKKPIHVLSVISSGSYEPYAAAVYRKRDIAFDMTLQHFDGDFSYSYKTIESTIVLQNSMAIISASEANQESNSPSISVEFETTNGLVYFTTRLGDQHKL
jgi:cholesterol oxidase